MLQTFPQPTNKIILVLATLRQEWQQAAEGASLLEMEANVGFMLADLVMSLELSEQEQTLVLGPDLYAELHAVFGPLHIQ